MYTHITKEEEKKQEKKEESITLLSLYFIHVHNTVINY